MNEYVTGKKLRVLFLCTANSCRSQMAEGMLNHVAGERFEAMSAGTHPTGLNPLAVEAMTEIGIDISAQRSKSVGEMLRNRFDYVITVCDTAREFCPVFPSPVANLHWNLEDPSKCEGPPEEQKEAFRRVREKLKRLIVKFVGQGPE